MEEQLNEIETTVRGIVATILELEPEAVAADARFVDDLGADSMSALELMARVEKHYGIVILPENLPKMRTVRAVAALAGELIQAKAGRA
ncbi:MAG TPA: acyl carrier protein [Elusimicrobiota bacterium]|nr:acyl carrier protein [Elusimicrobiota bacterium]